jgi:transcriptional regulator with XRE-family HTH domain
MTTTIERLLGQFVDAWTTGGRPDVRDYLARAPEDERGELAARISAWLEVAPTPRYDAAALERIAAEPALAPAFAELEAEPAGLAEQVAALRERAGLAVSDVAARLVALFHAGDPARAQTYLERLEGGDLDESRLSRRLLGGLAAILGADPAELPARPAFATGQTFFRADGEAGEWVAEGLDALSRAAMVPAPEGEPLDELDRLFCGGPDA